MTQPEALRLAEWIESDMSCHGDAEIAAELRRLADVEAQREVLLEALERIAQLSMSQFHIPYDMAAEACNIASAAIKQAEGENT